MNESDSRLTAKSPVASDWDMCYHCPNCDYKIGRVGGEWPGPMFRCDKFCPDCGQALEWAGEDWEEWKQVHKNTDI